MTNDRLTVTYPSWCAEPPSHSEDNHSEHEWSVLHVGDKLRTQTFRSHRGAERPL